MFVNDTTRLPDSGRICVMGFQQKPGTDRRFYSLLINAARAEVEAMAEPRNPAHVLGVGAEIATDGGAVFAAYFAGSRERYDTHPNYKDGLFVLVDGAVYSVRDEGVDTSIRRGFTTRTFTLLRSGRPQRRVVYPWPWYREAFGAGAPSSRTADFLREVTAMVREFGGTRA